MLSRISKLIKPLNHLSSSLKALPNSNFGTLSQISKHPYYLLCRWDKPIGCMLLYWPTVWGVAIGASTLPPLSYFALFFLGAWSARSAGCIINDYFDRDFDKKVERCKTRPLASGAVSLKEALGLALLNVSASVYVCTQLPLQAILAVAAISPVAALYPLAKRYTNYPQLVLGVAFNSGIIVGGLTMAPQALNWPVTLLIYAGGVCWTLVYDTVYAYQDIEDDRELGLHSTAITWEKDPKQSMTKALLVSFGLTSATALFDPTYVYCLPGFAFSYSFLYWLLQKVDLSNREECGKFFRRNTYFGLFILISIMMKNFASSSPDEIKSSRVII